MQGIERCLRQVLQILPALETRGDNASIMTSNTGQGTVLNVSKDYIRSLLGRGGSNFFNLTEAQPKAYTNYCTIFKEDQTVALEPTQTYIKNAEDSGIYIGLGPQIMNINGMVKEFNYEDLAVDATDVGSRSFYDPEQILDSSTQTTKDAAKRVMGLWKVSDLILQSNPSGGIHNQISINFSTIKELSFLLRLKCSLVKSETSVDPTFLMPWVYTWKIRPSMIFEGGYQAIGMTSSLPIIGPGYQQYFNGEIPTDWGKVSSWYVTVGRVSLTNCTDFVKNVCSNVTPNTATFDVSVQTTNFMPTLTIALTTEQIQNILNVNNTVNNS